MQEARNAKSVIMVLEMSRPVCLDNNALSYATLPQQEKKYQDVKEKLCARIDRHKEENVKIFIPDAVLFEYLVTFPVNEHDEIITLLSENFTIYSPTTESAKIAAKMFIERKGVSVKSNVTRENLKLDYLISAAAIDAKCEIIYSEDRDYSWMTKEHGIRHIKPSTLPMPSKQKIIDEVLPLPARKKPDEASK